jgi:hypothetical protein
MADYDGSITTSAEIPPREFIHKPQIRLLGEVNEDMLLTLLDGLAEAEGGSGPLAIEVTTLGGDAEIGRRIVLELDLARERLQDRRLVFIGKTIVYSAGTTIMSAFTREDRFLSSDAVLLIHTRQLEKTVDLSGPIRASLPLVNAVCEQLKLGVKLEEEGFQRLIAGSDIGMDELLEKALHNWYVTTDEALERGLVAAII